MFKYCFIIPCYQHSATLEKVLQGLAPFQHKVFVINDGSDAHHRDELVRICSQYDFVELLHHSENQGKGVACITGLSTAHEQGFTHGVQIDSDGQHDLSKVPELLAESRKHPQDLISGQPYYDESVPKSRLYGRYVTHVWVWIETLSFKLKDSMCGFRVYPLASTIEIFRKNSIGKRMDFDTEIMVRLYWSGVQSQFVSVPVIYPENGISHFDVWKDNVRISKMHTKLFFGMLPRMPILLFRKFRNKNSDLPWHRIEEVGSVFGIRLLLLFYKMTGRKVLNWLLYPIAFYYSQVSTHAKTSSKIYQNRLLEYSKNRNLKFSTFQHVYSFACTAIDKFAVWFGDIKYADLVAEDVDDLLKVLESDQGAFFISSHYGNIEVCRSLGRFSKARFNALVYHENAQKFNSYLGRVRPESNLNLISVKEVGPELAIALKDKLEQKEWIFIMGDRLSVQENQRTLEINLLGKPAQIPEGPFTMAYVMDAPVYIIHCFREGSRFRIKLKLVENHLERGRTNRDQIVRNISSQYAAELEQLILNDPLQWYNFFNFWGTTR